MEKLKNYNEMLEQERKTELPPVYEPLLLNCDLLFALADEMDISDSSKEQIDQILHADGEDLFLIQSLDEAYRFDAQGIPLEEVEINISSDGEEMTIPVKYIGEASTITLVIQNEDIEITDWEIKEVNRSKEGNIDTFSAVYASKTAKKTDFEAGMTITVELDVRADSNLPKLTLEYTVESKPRWGFIPDKITFQRSDI